MKGRCDMGRKRRNDPMRDIYPDKRWGYWVWRPYLGKGKRGKAQKLVPLTEPESAALRARERLEQPQNTFRWLSEGYLQSAWLRQKKPDTQTSYKRYHRQLCKLKMTDGRTFGDYLHTEVTGILLRQYLDSFIGDDGELLPGAVLANRHFAYIQTVYSWARNYGHTHTDPCRGIKKLKEKPKRDYVRDDDYYHALFMPGPEYMPFVMELAYLCRARKSVEILKIKLFDDGESPFVSPEGVLLRRGKGSKTQLIRWTPRLKAVVEQCKRLYGVRSAVYLIHGPTGRKIGLSTLNKAWQQRMKDMVANGGKRFTLHSLKAKGVTDFEGDKHAATGDKSKAMVSVYDRTPVEAIESTK